jgi:uncharacterized membrane protein
MYKLGRAFLVIFLVLIVIGSAIDGFNLLQINYREEFRTKCRAANGVAFLSLGGNYYCIRKEDLIEITEE